MNNRGFISSSLLYGLLAVFLVVMLSIIALLGSKKLSMDKLKKNALEDINVNYEASSNIVAWYDSFYLPFYDGEKHYWKDLTGNGHDGIITGVINTGGRHLYFDDKSPSISVKDLSISNDFTISTCVRLTENVGTIFSVGNVSVNVINESGYKLQLCNNGECSTHVDFISDGKIETISLVYDKDKLSLNAYEGTEVIGSFRVDSTLNNKIVIGKENSNTTDNTQESNDNLANNGLNKSNGSFIGHMYSFVVYNKSLGNKELNVNTEVNKNRFNSEL